MNESLTQTVAAAQIFADEVIGPNAEHWESIGRVPYDAFERAAEAGLCGLMVPTSLGGTGLNVSGMAAVTEVLASACLSSTFSFVVHNNLAAHIAHFGTTEQIERFVPDMVAGRRIGAFLLTEPGTGSDAQAIATTATAIADGWQLNGEKAWVSNGTFADVLSVYAQTKPGSGSRGIASFLVESETTGVSRGDATALMRGHALGTATFRFTDCILGEDQVLRPPGEAFAAAMAGINAARANVAAMCCGALRRSLSVAINYASARQAFGRATTDFQGVQWLLTEASTDLEAALLLTKQACTSIDSNDPAATVAAAHAKKFATRAAFNRISDCMQAMGAAGYSSEYPLARHLAAAKMAQFLDGTSEIQNLVIGRALADTYAPTTKKAATR